MHIMVNQLVMWWELEIKFQNNQLKIDLYDKGKPAIPQNIKPRQIDDVKPGGLGTFFIGQIMDEVVFKTSASDWVNHLILKKLLIFIVQ